MPYSAKYSNGRVYGSQRQPESIPTDELDDQNTVNYSSSSEPPKGWDVFIASPADDEDETLSSKGFDYVLKFLKLCAFIVSFVIILCSAVLSKSTLLLITSLIRPNRTGIAVCNQGVPGLDRDKHYEAILNVHDPERTAWIWCLLLVLVVPELMTLFRSCRICTFKSYRRPSKSVFALVSSF
jgi:chitin synthase